MKFDGASSRVGKVVDSVLQTSVGRPQNDDIELLKKRPLMDYVFSPSSCFWHLEHNSKAAQELASLDSVQIVHSICCELLFTQHQKQNLWVAIGPREKPHPLVLNKAEKQ